MTTRERPLPWNGLPIDPRAWDAGHWHYANEAGQLRQARAQYVGVCPLCEARISKGMPILYAGRRAVHLTCLRPQS